MDGIETSWRVAVTDLMNAIHQPAFVPQPPGVQFLAEQRFLVELFVVVGGRPGQHVTMGDETRLVVGVVAQRTAGSDFVFVVVAEIQRRVDRIAPVDRQVAVPGAFDLVALAGWRVLSCCRAAR